MRPDGIGTALALSPGDAPEWIQKQMIPSASRPAPQPVRLDTRATPPHILIVDDQHGVTRALATVLKRSGFEATTFNSGRQAIDFVCNSRSSQPIAAVVLDIHMPDMSGLVVSQKMRTTLGPEVPIVILSGDCSMETLNSLPHVGATHFFSKPIRADQLVAYLRDLTKGP